MSVSRNQDRQAPKPAQGLADRYQSIHQGFGWKVPKRFNMAQACCGQWAAQPATAKRQAIREHVAGQGLGRSWTFGQLQQHANRLSQVLRAQGVRRGDRVAIVMPQRFETAVAYMAVLQMGAVAMPLSMLFGPEALSFRINDSQARVAVCDESTLDALLQARPDCPGLQTLIGLGQAGALADLDGHRAMAASPGTFKPVRTLAEDPAVRAIVLTGGEKVFAAGGDIKGLEGAGPIEILERHTERVWAPIERCPKPIIAAVCGYAFGGGAELAMHCDIILAGEGASFSQPEIRIGIMPGIGGTQRLVRAVGKVKAMRMALTGKPITAHGFLEERLREIKLK